MGKFLTILITLVITAVIIGGGLFYYFSQDLDLMDEQNKVLMDQEKKALSDNQTLAKQVQDLQSKLDVAVSSAEEAASIPQTKSYTGDGYSFDYSRDWHIYVKKSPVDGVRTMIDTKPIVVMEDTEFFMPIYIEVLDNKDALSLADYYEKIRPNEFVKIFEETDVQFAGKTAKKLVFEDMGGNTLDYIVVTPEKIYKIMIMDFKLGLDFSKEGYELPKEVLDFLSSFEIK